MTRITVWSYHETAKEERLEVLALVCEVRLDKHRKSKLLNSGSGTLFMATSPPSSLRMTSLMREMCDVTGIVYAEFALGGDEMMRIWENKSVYD